eukprot:357107_1
MGACSSCKKDDSTDTNTQLLKSLTSIDLWHKQYTSTLLTSNDSLAALTLNTIEIALRLNQGEKPSTSFIDNVLSSIYQSSLYTWPSKSTFSDIEPSDILSNITRYELSFELVDFIQKKNIQRVDQVVSTLNKYVSQTKQAVTCILRNKKNRYESYDANKLNIILLYKNYKSKDYIIYEPQPRFNILNTTELKLFCRH